MISVMEIIVLLAFVAFVVAVNVHHHRTQGLPHAPHGSDSSIDFTDLDHDWDRVQHDADARH
jgi:hypothetical protein